MAKKTKKIAFPVKQFQLPGGELTQKQRVTVVREAIGKSHGKSKAAGHTGRVMRAETASGSGKVSFFVFTLTSVVKKAKVPTIGTRAKGKKVVRSASVRPGKSAKQAAKKLGKPSPRKTLVADQG